MNTFDKDYDYLVKLLLIGDAGVGKSTLCEKLSRGEFINTYNSTIGVDFFSLFVPIDHKMYKIQIWDTAGQERFKAITRSYYKNSKIVLFMIDLHDTEGINNEEILNNIKKIKSYKNKFKNKNKKISKFYYNLLTNKKISLHNDNEIELINKLLVYLNDDFYFINPKNSQNNIQIIGLNKIKEKYI